MDGWDGKIDGKMQNRSAPWPYHARSSERCPVLGRFMQQNGKAANFREGEAPAEPKWLQNTAQQWLRPPLFRIFQRHCVRYFVTSHVEPDGIA
jgi:hypothetical protein